MDKKYFLPAAVGGVVLLLALAAAFLFVGGQENEGAGMAAAALALAEGARRLRNTSHEALDEVEEDAEASNEAVEEIKEKLVADMEDTDHTVDGTTLDDLVDEENA